VLGCDQMLECGGVWFDKPPDRAHAAAHLRALAGKTHRLVSAVVAYRKMVRVWHHVDSAKLVMRPLSDSFIESYLDRAGDDARASVGAYQLESLGAQLFTRVEGDYFTVLGLPLLPLLGFLRANGVVAE
jgi:septum formation protein